MNPLFNIIFCFIQNLEIKKIEQQNAAKLVEKNVKTGNIL